MAEEQIVGLKISQLPRVVAQALAATTMVEVEKADGTSGYATIGDLALQGEDGKDALEVVMENDPSITSYADWQAKLKGEDGADAIAAWLALPENAGKTVEDYENAIRGADGLGAFEEWKARPGNEGKTEADFDAFNKGEDGLDAFEAWQARPGNENKTIADYDLFYKGADGDDGLSAFEVWKEIPGNEDKTQAEYDAFNKGETGLDAKAEWLARPGNEGKTEADYDAFYKGETGLNALEEWLARPENEGKSQSDYDAAIKGEQGLDAFQTWLARPENEGKTQADYDASIKGKDAPLPVFMGVVTTLPPVAGVGTNEVYFKYNAQDQATHFHTVVNGAWVDHGNFQGPRGFSAYEIAQQLGFVGTIEEYEASIHGQDGIGLTILGSLPGTEFLPTEGMNSGDTYIILEKMYVWDTEQWSTVGQVGPKGKDAYEDAYALDPSIGTRQQWLASLKGDDAITAWLGLAGNEGKTITDYENAIRGAQGYDAFQTWLRRPENTGKTQDDYDAFYRGARGKDALVVAMENDPAVTDYATWRESLRGDPAQTVSILGVKETEEDLPTTGEQGTGWVIDGKVYGWDTQVDQFVFFSELRGIPGQAGKDALQVVMDNDPTILTYEDWQRKITGPKGENGDNAYVTWTKIPGNEGKTMAEYQAFNRGAKGDDGDDAITAWLALPENVGKDIADYEAAFKGDTGLDAFEAWVARPGNAGKTEADYDAYYKGDPGDDGKDALEDWLARPGNEGKTQTDYDDFYRGEDLYQNWIARPENEGKTRDDFDAFYRGEDLRTEWFSRPGNEGKTEADFDAAFQGRDGVAFMPDVVLAEGQPLPTEPTEGMKVRLGDVAYVYREGQWDNLGNWGLKGEKGDDGDDALEVVMANDQTVTNYEEWQAKLKGADGLSAPQEWLARPENEGKNLNDYDEYYKGETGASYIESWLARPENDGKTEADLDEELRAKNNYELWVALPGNAGKTQSEYQEYLRAKNNYEVWEALPENDGKTEQQYFDSLKAKNNYELWLELPGNAGKTEAEYQESLKGTDGKDGVSFIPDAVVEEGGELPASPTEGMKVNFAGIAYIYRDAAWENLGSWRGPIGGQGVPGKSFLEVAMEADPEITGWSDLLAQTKGDPGNDGDTGADAITAWFALAENVGKTMADYQEYFRGRPGVKGDQGEKGAGLQIRDKVADEASLPATGAYGDAYLIGTNYWFWSEDQTQWIDGGALVGPKGDQGDEGLDAIEAWFALPGNEDKGMPDYVEAFRGPVGLDQYETAQKYDPSITTYAQWVTKIRGEKGDRGHYIYTEDRDPTAVDGLPGDLFMNKGTMQYFRKMSTVLWAPMGYFGGGNVFDTTNDGKKKVRVFNAWVDLPFDTITGTGLYFGSSAGWVKMDTYDVKTQVQTGTTALTPSTCQVYHIDMTTSRTFTLPNFDKAGRTTTLVLILHGNAGILTLNGRVNWGTAGLPEFAAGYTVLTLLWDEVGNQWVGSGGSAGVNLAA